MSTRLLHGQMSVVDENGNVTIMHQETSASDVLVDRSNNVNGSDGGTAIPEDVDDVQTLANRLGVLAFKTKVETSDIDIGVIVNNYTTTQAGHALDARAGSDLNNRVKTIEDSEYIYVEDSESTDETLPESEINDNTISETLTWSSSKIDTEMRSLVEALDLSQNFYIPLLKDEYNTYISQKTVAEIEEAYQKGKALWVIASEIFLPLSKRIDSIHWVFSGYTATQGYDIEISNKGVTVTYREIVTKSLVQGLQTTYDEETNTVSFI